MEIVALLVIALLLYVGVSMMKDDSGKPSSKSSRRNSRPNNWHK
jgi:hypothetical protein